MRRAKLRTTVDRYELLVNIAWLDATDANPTVRGYLPGDRLVATWRGTLPPMPAGEAATVVFERHNSSGRPDRHVGPSLSVGDVIVLSGTDRRPVVVAVAPAGFVPVDSPAAAEVERTRGWRELTRA